jgi:hypothetical protein
MGIRTNILRRIGLQPIPKALPPVRRRNYAGAIISRLTSGLDGDAGERGR